jgi:small subunit ribosomal protein S8
MMTDPIADMLTRIRNAQRAGKAEVIMPASKLKKAVANILVAENYLASVTESTEGPKQLVMVLKYNGREGVIRHLDRESKPGHRKYTTSQDLPKVLNDYGIAIVSTSQGIMTNKQARRLGIGGEIICSVY